MMQSTLNFAKEDIPKIKAFLSAFQEKPCMDKYQEKCCLIGSSTVTLYSTGKINIQGDEAVKVKELLLEALGTGKKNVLGFDETGRGEDNGTFVTAFVLGETNDLRELRDSKKTSKIAEKKDVVTAKAKAWGSVSLSSKYVDELRNRGINMNQIETKIIDAVNGLFNSLQEKRETIVDGSPMKVKSPNIAFKPKADDLEPVVGAASIIARAERDSSQDKGKRTTWKTPTQKKS